MTTNSKIFIGATILIGAGILTAIIWAMIPTEQERMDTQLKFEQDQQALQTEENERIKNRVKEVCFGTAELKKTHDQNLQCYFTLGEKLLEGEQAIIDWREGKKEEWENKIKFTDGLGNPIEKENILIEEFTDSDGSIWTLAATPPDPNLIQGIKEGLEDLIQISKKAVFERENY